MVHDHVPLKCLLSIQASFHQVHSYFVQLSSNLTTFTDTFLLTPTGIVAKRDVSKTRSNAKTYSGSTSFICRWRTPNAKTTLQRSFGTISIETWFRLCLALRGLTTRR